MSAPTRTLPPLGPTRRLKLPGQAERTLDNGLTVIVVRRPAVPLVELRLWMPFVRAHLARGHLLAQTLLSGTETMSSVQIAAELQRIGGGLSAGLDPDRLMLSGTALATGLDRMLEILADVVTGASYPAEWVGVERDRLVDGIQVARSQPAHLARTALLRRIFGRHPYSTQTPDPEQVRAVRPAALRTLHALRVRPAGAVLVLVGDVRPEQALDTAEKALAGWQGGEHAAEVPPVPPLEPGPLLLVDRPGSVQSSMRMALPAVPRTHPDHAALQLANLIFGGYFSSRWVENIREDKGYTYGPHSMVEHSVGGSLLLAAAEVATEVTAPALLETTYELGRLATVPPKQEELDQARQYALGTLQLGIATQAGLASFVSAYAGSGLRLDFLAEHAARLAKASVDDVTEAAARYLAPSRAVTVVLGDAERIEPSLSTLTPVQTTPATP
ncbi:M16 family metallopeptidase [Micromonospora craniellae]|uniref:Insulinase family protein n=1 Tax=Micromonospora craniellae TaxID=2294034 RepID=A0A372G581_9ACTN|nr:pitrilysin family protein [Micromonospora craniellae]QOC90459.1 insulinase family protein [Micromonospora craniellae]RFS48153.1 insulinase family protein [Micromonospora craniellae]